MYLTKTKSIFIITILILSIFYIFSLLIAPAYISSDEIYWYVWASENNLWEIFQPTIERGCMEEMFFRPLLRTYVLLSYLLFDTNFYGYKFILLLVNIGSIFLAYKVGKLYSNEKTGLIFALLFTFLNPIISTAFFSRAHQIFEVFFLLLSILFLKKISIDTNKTNMFLFILSSALAFLSRESSIVLIPLFLYFFPLDKKLKRKLLLYLIMIIVPLLVINKFIFIILDSLFSSISANVILLLFRSVFDNLSAVWLLPYFIILSLSAYFFAKYRKGKDMKAFAVFMLVGLFFLFFYTTYANLPAPPEYFALSLIPAFLLLSVGITTMKNGYLRYFTIAVIGILIIFNVLPTVLGEHISWYYSFKGYESMYGGISLVESRYTTDVLGKPLENFDYQCNLKAIANIAKIEENRVLYLDEVENKKPHIFYLITYPWMMDTTNLKEKIESVGYYEIGKNLYRQHNNTFNN